MSDETQCAQCGAPLSAGAPEGLCPACLLKRGLESQTAGGAAADFTPPPPDELAAQFPQLEILELLGRGGMGVVYKARQRELDRLVALKILPPSADRDPAFAERFTREARALARLSHPNIVAVYDFGQAGGFFYFVMEFIDGLNLRQLLATSAITPAEALAIVPQICDALQMAHDQGIVHRDIKPENILLDKKGRVKIADFGIAKIVGSDSRDMSLTGAGELVGTPAYMAPEQIEHPRDVDHRADIYSLGVVFYQMLTGELPLGKFAAPSRKVQIDIRLDDVVLRALEKQPELRYQQASEVKTQIETIAKSPHPATPSPRPRLAGRNLAIAGAVLQLGSIFSSFWTVFGMMSAFRSVSESGSTNAQTLATAIGSVLEATAAGMILGAVGLILLCIALTALRYRANWFFWFLVIYGWPLLLVFPAGTPFGIFFLVYCLSRRDEFIGVAANLSPPTNSPHPTARFGRLPLWLLLIGLLGTPVLLAISPRQDFGAAFGALALLLALIFGLIDWRTTLGRGVAATVTLLFVVLGMRISIVKHRFYSAMEASSMKMEANMRQAMEKHAAARKIHASPAPSNLQDTSPNAAHIDEPPQLRYLAWQDENTDLTHWRGWRPDGTPVSDKDEPKPAAGFLLPTPINVSSTGDAKENPRFLYLWFSHPSFDHDCFERVTLLDPAGQPMQLGAGGSVAYSSSPSDAATGTPGWITYTLSPGNAGQLPPSIGIRLEYSVGPWSVLQQKIPSDYSGSMSLGNNVMLGSIGETAQGNTFISVTRSDMAAPDTQFEFFALTRDGRSVRHGGFRSSGFPNLLTETSEFPVKLADVTAFRLLTRPIRKVEFTNIPLPSQAPVVASSAASAAPVAQGPKESRLIVNVRYDGSLIVNDEPLSGAGLIAKLRALKNQFPNQAVIIRTDKNVDYKSIVNVLDLCRQAGIWNVAFASVPTIRPEASASPKP